MKKPLILGLSLVGIFLIGALISGAGSKPSVKKNALQPAPSAIVTDISNAKFNLSDYKGKVLIVNFWATWCPPCVAEIPALIELQTKHAADIQVIGISVDHTKDLVAPFAKSKNISYPIGFLDPTTQAKFGKIESIPTTLIIDRNFNIVKTIVGFHDYNGFYKEIKPFL
jgi:thiol-disulfide isomerase/thioredoxin